VWNTTKDTALGFLTMKPTRAIGSLAGFFFKHNNPLTIANNYDLTNDPYNYDLTNDECEQLDKISNDFQFSSQHRKLLIIF